MLTLIRILNRNIRVKKCLDCFVNKFAQIFFKFSFRFDVNSHLKSPIFFFLGDSRSSSTLDPKEGRQFKSIVYLILSRKIENKPLKVNLIHTFVWSHIHRCHLTLVHCFCLSNSPIRGTLDVFHWLSSCEEKSISKHPAAAGPLLTYQMGHWRRNWPHLFLMSP